MCCKIQNLIDQLRSCWLSCTVDSGHAERGSVCSICHLSFDHLRSDWCMYICVAMGAIREQADGCKSLRAVTAYRLMT